MPLDDTLKDLVGEINSSADALRSDKSPQDVARAFDLEQTFGTPAQQSVQDLPTYEALHREELGKQIISSNPYIREFININPLHGPLIKDDLGSMDDFVHKYGTTVRHAGPMKEGGFFGKLYNAIREKIGGPLPSPSAAPERGGAEFSVFEAGPEVPGGIQVNPGRSIAAGVEGAQTGVYTGLSKLLQQPWMPGGGLTSNDAERIARHTTDWLTTGAQFAQLPEFWNVPAGGALHGEVLPPEAPKGLPPGPEAPPPPTIEAEPGPTDVTRRGFLQGFGAAAIASAPQLKALDATIAQAGQAARLADPMVPQAFARQYIYMFGENKQLAMEHLLDLANEAGPNFKQIYSNAAELIRSGAIDQAGPSIYENMVEQMRQHDEEIRAAQQARLHADADERPPPDVHEEIDKGYEEENKQQLSQLDEIFQAANSIKLKTLFEPKFIEFMNSLPKAMVHINIEAFDKLYGEKAPQAGDNLLGDLPGLEQLQGRPQTVAVPLSSFVARVEPEVYKEIKDFVSLNDAMSKVELENLRASQQALRESKAAQAREPPETLAPSEASAIKFPNGETHRGNLHFEALEKFEAAHPELSDEEHARQVEGSQDGFITSRNRFVDRQEAARIVEARPRSITDPSLGLTSEDFDALREQGKLLPLFPAADNLPFEQVPELYALSQRKASLEEYKANPLMAQLAKELAEREGEQVTPAQIIREFPSLEFVDPATDQKLNAKQAVARAIQEVTGQHPLQRGREVTLFLGPPGAGKSTAIEPYAKASGSAILSTDDFKHFVPEYQGGFGSSKRVALEAGTLKIEVMKWLQANGFNFTDEKIGDKYADIVPWIQAWKDAGYKVNLVHVSADLPERLSRIVQRFIRSGRPVDLDYAAARQLDTRIGYEQLKPHINGSFAAFDSTRTGAHQPPDVVEGAGGPIAGGVGGGKPPPPREPPPPPRPPEGPGPRRIFFKAKAIGRSERVFDRYERRYQEALLAQQEALLKRELKLAEKENSEAWKKREAELEPGLRQEMQTWPEIVPYRFFRDGLLPDGRKISGRAPRIKRSTVPDELTPWIPDWVTTKKGGIDINTAVSLLGSDSAEGLVMDLYNMDRAAAGTPPGKDILDRLVQAELSNRLQSELGETAQERLDEAYEKALLSPSMMELLHERTLLLGHLIGTQLPLTQMAMRLGALDRLGRRPFGSWKASRFLRESQRFGAHLEEDLLKGDYEGAFKNAQAQEDSLNEWKEAQQVEKEFRRFKAIRRIYNKRNPENRDARYSNWIHDILERISKPGDEPRGRGDIDRELAAADFNTLPEFLNDRINMGREVYVPDFLVNQNFRQALEEMPTLQARQAMGAIRNLDKLSRDEKQFITKTGKVATDVLVEQLGNQLASFKIDPDHWTDFNSGPATLLRSATRWGTAFTVRLDFILNAWDREDRFGPFNQMVMRPMIEAENVQDALNKEFAEKFSKLEKVPLTREQLEEKIPNPLFKDPQTAKKVAGKYYDFTDADPYPNFTRKHLRAVLLNAGNAGNLEKLAQGYGLKPEDVWQWLEKYAKKEDWDWAQAHGNLMQELKAKADEVYRRMSGMAPPDIPVKEFGTKWGKYPGWYHPIIYDPVWKLMSKAEQESGGEALFGSNYVRAFTPNGYTKERKDFVSPLDLSLDHVTSQITQRIHDIAYREAVVNASKLFYNDDFNFAVKKNVGKEYQELFIPWLKNLAGQKDYDSQSARAALAVWDYLRQNAISNMVGMNIRTVQKHGISAAASSIREAGGEEFLDALLSVTTSPNRKANKEFALSKSPELQRRSKTFIEQIGKVYPHIVGDRTPLEEAREFMARVGTIPVASVDMLSAIPTWIAVYKRVLGERNNDADAVYAADVAVSRAHGSMALPVRPEIMRKIPQFTQLYNFMNRQAGYQFEMAFRMMFDKKAVAPKDLAAGLFTNVILPGLVDVLVSEMPEGQSPLTTAGKSIATGLTAPWPGIRDIAHAMLTGRDLNFGIMSSEFSAFTKLGADVMSGQLAKDPGKQAKAAIQVIGLLTGLTWAEMGNVAEFMINIQNNRQVPKDVRELYRGLTKGKLDVKSSPDLIERMLKFIGGKK